MESVVPMEHNPFLNSRKKFVKKIHTGVVLKIKKKTSKIVWLHGYNTLGFHLNNDFNKNFAFYLKSLPMKV